MARKILLADDSVTAQNMGRKILTDAGYEVVTVNNGSAALKKVTEAHPDLIVLDVYMPGYSGLEVCQRIKDSRDTADIPVLLTVGKLEPFKQDEARRVRADAFIIKPFEASELMAAVAKLESKAGSSPGPRKESRHPGPATMDTFERIAAAKGPQYGDEESGWKSRIKFPSAEPKQPEPEPEPEALKPASSGDFRELISETPGGASFAPSMPDRPIPAGIPQDITPDEIAAIAAAAARIKGGISVGKNFERLSEEKPAAKAPDQTPSARVDEPKPEKTAAAQIPAFAEIPSAVTEVSAKAAEIPALEQANASKSEVAVTKADASGPAPVEAPRTAVAKAETEPVTVAATASPSEPAASVTVESTTPRIEESEPVTVAAMGPAPDDATVSAASSVANWRWVAEEIPVDAAESALVLEREMHKAFAAYAAAEHAQSYRSEPVDRDDEPMFATMAPPAIGTPLPMVEAAAAPQSESSKEEATAAKLQMTAVSDAEISKPPAPPFAPAGTTRDESGHALVAFGGPELMGSSSSDETGAAAEAKSVDARLAESEPAAVASESKSASADAEPTNVPQPVALDDRRDTDLAAATAAAWANWRDVRDSVLGPQSAPETSQSPLAVSPELDELKKFKGLKKDEPAPPAVPEAAMAAAASADSSSGVDPALSHIVDDMLAELKPKLMAELAEKLKKEKTKK